MKDKRELLQLAQVSLSVTRADERFTVLRDISLILRAGDWLTVAGVNGCGKSTLAKVLAGLVMVTAGSVSCSIPDRPAVQLVLQNPDAQIVGETVYEDAAFGLANFGFSASEIRRRVEAALAQVGLLPHARKSPLLLSGGQKQLLAIAGCLALAPPVLIFDEATAMLDPAARQGVMRLARTYNRSGGTVVWITQLLDELAADDRVIALERGSVVFAGSGREFFYGSAAEGESACARLGFAAPYPVRLALALLKRGCKLEPLPVTPEELGQAVGGR